MVPASRCAYRYATEQQRNVNVKSQHVVVAGSSGPWVALAVMVGELLQGRSCQGTRRGRQMQGSSQCMGKQYQPRPWGNSIKFMNWKMQ